MPMFLLTYLAVPTSEAKEFHESGGAYVSCWIRSEERGEAGQRATDLIHEYGWSVESLQEGAVVTSADYAGDDEDREFYEQALVEGEVLVFNTWPRSEDEDEDDDFEDDEEEEDEEGDEDEARIEVR
jgi:hypothetical protein